MKLDEDAHLVKVEPGDIARADALVLHQAALVCKRGKPFYASCKKMS